MNIELEKSELMKLLSETNDESIIASIKKKYSLLKKKIFGMNCLMSKKLK